MQKLTKYIIFTALLSLFIAGCASTATSESTGQYLDSTAITTKVKADLAKNISVSSLRSISVSTYKGVVQLSGFVNSQQEMNTAVSVANAVAGVKKVENSLLVKSKT